MIEDAHGTMEYDETGSGPAIVLVPGSCGTGAALSRCRAERQVLRIVA